MLISYQSLYNPNLLCVWVDGRKCTERSCSPVWELGNLARWPITLSPVFFREFWMLHLKLKLWPFSVLATIFCSFVSEGKYLSNYSIYFEEVWKGMFWCEGKLMDNDNTVSCAACLICFTFPTLVSATCCCHRSKGKLDSISHFCSLSSIHILNSILIGKVSNRIETVMVFSMERSFNLLEV